jgi:hypothetical protein
MAFLFYSDEQILFPAKAENTGDPGPGNNFELWFLNSKLGLKY